MTARFLAEPKELESPPLFLRYTVIMGASLIGYYLTGWRAAGAQSVWVLAVYKFINYGCVILFLNSAYYMSQGARGVDVETWEFQKKQVKLSLWIVAILIVPEIPMWLSVLGYH